MKNLKNNHLRLVQINHDSLPSSTTSEVDNFSKKNLSSNPVAAPHSKYLKSKTKNKEAFKKGDRLKNRETTNETSESVGAVSRNNDITLGKLPENFHLTN